MDKDSFTSTLVSDLLSPTKVKCVLTTDTVANVYKTLNDNGIHSAPVVGEVFVCVQNFVSLVNFAYRT